GSAFVFRTYGSGSDDAERRWGRVFAIASTVTPLFLGVVVGALASGNVGRASATGSTYERFVAPWVAPFPIAVRLLAIPPFGFLAAVYLTAEAKDIAIREDFRRRAIGAALAVFAAASATLAIALREAPRVGWGLTESGWALAVHSLTAVTAITAIVALWRREF